MDHLTLTTIGARNLKGFTFEVEITPVTFFIGANFKGKTARADAIRLLLIGHLPELGKTNEATFGLSSGKELAVWGTLKDRLGHTHAISRRWFLKGDSIKKEEDVPPAFENPLNETMLNASSWFGLSERARVDWVYANSPVATSLTRDTVYGNAQCAIKSKIDAKEIELPPATEPDPVAEFFRHLGTNVIDAEAEDVPFEPPAFVEFVAAAAADLGKEYRAQAIVAEKGIQNLAGLRAADAAPPDLAAIEAKIKAANEDLADLRNTSATATALSDAQRTRRSRREFLKSALAGLPALEQQRAASADKIAKLKARRSELPDVDTSDIDELASSENEERSRIAVARSNLSTVEASINRNEGELSEIDGKTSCPYCGATGDGWKALRVAEIASTLAGLRARRDDLNETIAKATSASESFANRRSGKQAIRTESSAIDSELKAAELGAQKIETAIAALSGSTAELEAIAPDNPALAEQIVEIDSRIRLKNADVAALETRRKEALGRSNDLKRLAESEKARDGARTAEKIAKAAAESFRDTKAAMVADAFGPLLFSANSFCGGLLTTPLAFNPEKSEIGTYRAGIWVGHKTFSGVEQLLAYAAIQMAFAGRAPVRVMVLDELLRAQDTKGSATFTKLVLACKLAVKNGSIENFVGLIPGDVEDYEYLAPIEDEACKIIAVT
jgi:hypothetical protein